MDAKTEEAKPQLLRLPYTDTLIWCRCGAQDKDDCICLPAWDGVERLSAFVGLEERWRQDFALLDSLDQRAGPSTRPGAMRAPATDRAPGLRCALFWRRSRFANGTPSAPGLRPLPISRERFQRFLQRLPQAFQGLFSWLPSLGVPSKVNVRWNSHCTDEADARPAPPRDGLVALLAEALEIAEAFMSGFEGDETQDGIDLKLAQIRYALARERAVRAQTMRANAVHAEQVP